MRAAALLWTILPALAAAPAAAQDFTACLGGLRTAAKAAGVGDRLLDQALSLSAPDERILRFSEAQPEFKTPIWDYIGFLVDDQRIADGRAMLKQHDRLLRQAERQYGVDRHVIVAVWGVETDYGRDSGSNFLPHALATLSCASGRRPEFWRRELIAALSLVQTGDLQLDELKGSWAGAFGQTQFMPTTYQRLAVDFDGDGRRDLVASVADAIGSTANYLKTANWRTGEPWMIEVRNPAGLPLTSRTDKTPVSSWANRGVTRADGGPLPGTGTAGMFQPAGPEGPAFLVFPNFNAIYQYNHADSYALAISYLANRLMGGLPLQAPWPTDDPGLSRVQRLELQKLLNARGYDVGEPDGKIGPASRTAIANAEQQLGLPQTGRAGLRIYQALGGQ